MNMVRIGTYSKLEFPESNFAREKKLVGHEYEYLVTGRCFGFISFDFSNFDLDILEFVQSSPSYVLM